MAKKDLAKIARTAGYNDDRFIELTLITRECSDTKRYRSVKNVWRKSRHIEAVPIIIVCIRTENGFGKHIVNSKICITRVSSYINLIKVSNMIDKETSKYYIMILQIIFL